jgi:hypothetical protein
MKTLQFIALNFPIVSVGSCIAFSEAVLASSEVLLSLEAALPDHLKTL